MRLRLTPRDTSFFDLFAASAQHLVTGANLLGEMLGADRPTRKEIGKQIADAEHLADEATHTIMRRLNQTFVTPFDRDDIYDLASTPRRLHGLHGGGRRPHRPLQGRGAAGARRPTRSRCSSAPPS